MTTLSQHEQHDSGFKTACQGLLTKLQSIRTPRGSTERSYDIFMTTFSDAIVKPEDTVSSSFPSQSARTWISNSMGLLALHMNDALIHEPEYFAGLVGVIAVFSRDPARWAYRFGQAVRNTAENHKAAQQATEPDCVLEVARRALALDGQLPSSAVKDALRVIANCCANMNANRELILQRQGLDSMLYLAMNGMDLEILVPALFNVCSEYDQPPSYPESVARHDTDSLPRPSYAAEQLAGVYSSNEDFTTFELLLSFSSKVSEQMKSYLSLLIELATEPALDAFHYVRNGPTAIKGPWNWSFSISGNEYDTAALLLSLGQEDEECFSAMIQAGVFLLSQQEARDALLLRSDDAIWRVMTFACTADGHHNDDGESIDADVEPARKVFLKHLYEVTSNSTFPQKSERVSLLVSSSISELKAHLSHGESGQPEWIQTPAGTSDSFRLASACIILSQLVSSENVRESLIEDADLWNVLPHLFRSEANPDVLYPAVTIISRMALSTRQQLSMVDSGILEAMQRLLTAKGLGLIVPFETVTAYKTICRGRPATAMSLLATHERGTAVAADILTLWRLTVEAGTKLEVGKLFLEVFRTVLATFKEDENVRPDDGTAAKQFEASLVVFADSIGAVFTWLCTSAEPQSQRDHGWFGLAMLSMWPSGRQSILSALEHHDLGAVMIEVSQLPNGPVPNNMKLMLSNMHKAVEVTVSGSSQQLLEQAARNLGLTWSVQDASRGPGLTRPGVA